MSKLNVKKTLLVKPAPHGMALSGNNNLQFVKSPEQTLFEVVVGTLYGSDSMYEKADDRVKRLRDSLGTVIKTHGQRGVTFATRLAKFAREKMNMRTMPIVMTVELAKIIRDQKLTVVGVRQGVTDVISRADELTDLYAYALTTFGSKKAIPLAIKKGVADAFNKFDAYQFGKYNRDDGMRFRDLLRIVHPTPSNETLDVIFKKLMTDSLEAPFTWEVELSKNGQLPVDERRSKKDVWTEFVKREGSGSLGYMALIRNLRNMHEAGLDPETWKVVAEKISNPKAVAKSKQLPFRFINAYEFAKAAGVTQVALNALTDATELSLSNIPKMGDGVWIILDCSGSMNSAPQNPNIKPIKVGAIFGAALFKAAGDSFKSKFTMFDDYAKHVDLNARDSIFTLYEKIMQRNAGGGTNLQSAFDQKAALGFEPDTVIVISDMEVNRLSGARSIDSLFKKSCVKVAINLNSRDTTPLAEWNGWIQLAGWSERIFQYVDFTRNAESVTKKLFDSAEAL